MEKDLVRFFKGHCKLRYHLNKIKLAPHTGCRQYMKDDETTKYVSCTYPAATSKMPISFNKKLDL